MKSKEEIRKEIFQLAEKIKNASSEDLLLELAAELHEQSVLLKHSSRSDIQETINTKAGVINPDSAQTPTEKKQIAMDLFSEEPNTEIQPAPKQERIIPKETAVIKKKEEESFSETLQHKKIPDLKSVIGINEKFQFINELFEGSMNEYNIALDQINNFSSLGQATTYLANLKQVYKWKEDNLIASNFEELVQRRFF